MITGKRKYKKRVGNPRGSYKKKSKTSFSAPSCKDVSRIRDTFCSRPVSSDPEGLTRDKGIQLKITAGTIKLALTPGRPKYLGQHSALSALLKKYVYKKLDKISYENLKAFRVLFLSSLKNNTYNDSIDKLDSLSFFVSFFFFKIKIINKLFHISNNIRIVNPKAFLISDIHLIMLHEHLKFIQKKTERGTLSYVMHGEVVKYGGQKLDTKPIFLDKEESINAFGDTAYHKIMEKTDDYGRTAHIYINHAKILTTTRQSKA